MEKLLSHWHSLDQTTQVIDAVLLGVVAFGLIKLTQLTIRDMMESLKMKRRARLSKEVCEIIEDKFVEGLSEAINSGRLTIDEARMLYSKIAHVGFWGLQPRKFAPKKTAEDLAELKERLLMAREARKNSKNKSTGSLMDKLLDGLAEELAA